MSPTTQMPINTHVLHYLVVALVLQEANLDRQAKVEAKLNGEIMQEEIYDSSTCKNDDCVMCLEEFNKDEKIRVLASCQHSFHGYYINKWLLVNRSCPLCREPMNRSWRKVAVLWYWCYFEIHGSCLIIWETKISLTLRYTVVSFV